MAQTQRPAEGTLTIFVLQPDRSREVLTEDAELIAKCIQAAKGGDSIHAFTTSNQPILTFELKKGLNRLEQKRAVGIARGQLKQYFLKLFEKPPAPRATVVDVASALATAFDRFNYSREHAKLNLILLTDGLQHNKSISWRGGVPSDSWCKNPDSPFASINANATKAPLAVIMLPTQESYADQSHANLIKRWYSLFFHIKKAQLIAFTFDHRAAQELLLHNRPVEPPKPPDPVDLDGPLAFTRVEELVMQ